MAIVQINADGDDTELFAQDVAWAVAWGQANADAVDSVDVMHQLGVSLGATWNIWRNLYFFDTTALAGAINSAELRLTVIGGAGVGSTCQLQAHSGPSKPAVAGDYLQTQWSGNYGIKALGIGAGVQVVTITDVSIINFGGWTIIGLRDTEDATNTPSGAQRRTFLATGNSANPPRLDIDYTSGAHHPALKRPEKLSPIGGSFPTGNFY